MSPEKPSHDDIAGKDPLAVFANALERRHRPSVIIFSLGYAALVFGLTQWLLPATTGHLTTRDGVIGVWDEANTAGLIYSALFPVLVGILFSRQPAQIAALWRSLRSRGVLKKSASAQTWLSDHFDRVVAGYRNPAVSLWGPLAFLAFVVAVCTASQWLDGVAAYPESSLAVYPLYMAVWSLGFYMLIQATRRKIQTDTYLIQLLQSEAIRVEPGHPDRLGGLQTVGAWVSQGVRHAAVIGAALMFLTVEHLYLLRSGFTLDLWLLWGLYLVLAYLFFVRLWLHTATLLGREAEMQEDRLSAKIMRCMKSRNGGGDELQALVSSYESCRRSRNPLAPLTMDLGFGGVFNIASFAINVLAAVTPLAQFAMEKAPSLLG